MIFTSDAKKYYCFTAKANQVQQCKHLNGQFTLSQISNASIIEEKQLYCTLQLPGPRALPKLPKPRGRAVEGRAEGGGKPLSGPVPRYMD